jgi:hypothetical protein
MEKAARATMSFWNRDQREESSIWPMSWVVMGMVWSGMDVSPFCFFEQVSKQFFFEKKNQKTFVNLGRTGFTTSRSGAKFFCFFFSKKEVFSP